MSKVSWKFYSDRKKAKIDTFLRGILTHTQAIDKFVQMGIVPPMNLIQEFFEKQGIETEASIENSDNNSSEKDAKTNENTPNQKYDDLLIIDDEMFVDN